MTSFMSEEELAKKEEELLQEELTPAVSNSVAQVLMSVRCPVSINIDYNPQGEIKVRVSRKETYTTLAKQECPPVEDTSADIKTEENARSESIGFRVYFPDGAMVQRKNAKLTFIGTLKVIGLHRVAAFRGRLFKGTPLVCRKQRMDVDFKCQELVDGWYVYINMPNKIKKDVLRQISQELNLGLVIKDEMGNDVASSSEKGEADKQRNKRTLYYMNGEGPYCKRELVLLAVTQYMIEHPECTYEQLEKAFPQKLQGSYGVIRPITWIEEQSMMGKDHMNRYYTEQKNLLISADGIKFAVCDQWGDNFLNFVQHMKKMGWMITEE